MSALPHESSVGLSSDGPMDANDNVSTTSVVYDMMAEKWHLLHDLLGGTSTMRVAAGTWLPMEPEESSKAYIVRLNRSILYNAFADTVEKISSKPFSRSVTLEGTLPGVLEEIEHDVDGSGTNLTQFCNDLFTAECIYGLTHILVDFTNLVEVDDDGTEVERDTLSMADERNAGARPIFIHIKPPALIGWKAEKVDGRDVLSEIRIAEVRIEQVGQYGDKEVNFVRVYGIDSWELWKQTEDDKWAMESSGTHTFGSVPLVTIYINKTGFMQANPPLLDLAWLNLAHWQSYSDQRNILRFARTAILFAKGLTDEDISRKVTLGPNRIFRTTSEVADMKYVEHTGASIAAGERDLRTLVEEMEVLGLQPLIGQSGNQTATGKAIDEAKSQTSVQAWIRNEENGIREAYILAAEWLKAGEISDDFAINIFNEFGLSMRANEDIAALLQMRAKGMISHDTFITEVKRRGILSDNVDADTEKDLLDRDLDKSLFESDDDDEEEDGDD